MGCESCKLGMILVILISLLALAGAQQYKFSCMFSGNYSTNSTYGTNLNTLLTSLPTSISDSGFYNGSVGQNQDRVNALVLCRADQILNQCQNCVRSASLQIQQICPNQKEAIIWFEYCTIRYSNETIYGTLSTDPVDNWWNTDSAPNIIEIRAVRTRLFDTLRPQAADGGSVRKVSAGTANASDSGTRLVGMMQCTPDLSADECDSCLRQSVRQMQGCCDNSPGARALLPSCNLRFETFPFYNDTRLKELGVQLVSLPVPSSTPPPSPTGKKDDNTRKVVIIVVVPIAVCLLLAACAVIYMRKRMKRKSNDTTEATDEISNVESLQYDFVKIRAATNDFADANKLGEGGFGPVYRGKLLNGQDVAVKRLAKDSGQGNVEFKNEVLLVAKLQHRNLVRLLGFSMEGIERVLIYEFVQNGSLDQFIFDPIKRSYLDWDQRYKIIGAIAKGLLYLHEDSRLRIIHRDLKASNILLDGDMNPKIADFGMARLFGQDETQAKTSRIVGTFGYMSPEYAMHGQFSIKSDVFSFGVLVLEIISGQRNNYVQNGDNVQDLLTYTWKNWQEGTAENIIDPVLMRNGTGSLGEMMRCIHIGLLCVQENPANRPTMPSIVLMLSSSTVTMPVPHQPAFYMSSRFGPELTSDSKETNSSKASTLKAGISEGSSQNEMSATELYPR